MIIYETDYGVRHLTVTTGSSGHVWIYIDAAGPGGTDGI